MIGAIGVFEAAAELGLVELGVDFGAPNGGDIVGQAGEPPREIGTPLTRTHTPLHFIASAANHLIDRNVAPTSAHSSAPDRQIQRLTQIIMHIRLSRVGPTIGNPNLP